MKTGLNISALLAVSALSLAACGAKPETPAGAEPTAGGEPKIVVTDQAEWDSLLAQGKESFDRTCGTCHPGGEADLGPALKGHEEPMDEMHSQIRQGSGRMKPVGPDKLPEEEMKGLMVYLSSIGAVGQVQGP
jgi:mono/diheme cytochrome c family protein